MHARPAFALSSLLAFAALAGCTTGADSGSASIYVKDAPMFGFDEIHVVFTQVQVELEQDDDEDEHGDDDGNATEDDDDSDEDEAEDDDEDRLITLFSDSEGVDIDLLAANGTKAAFLGEANLPAGDYEEILVTVRAAYGIQNGTRVDFILEETVVELEHGFLVGAGRETRLVVDFDLAESLERKDGAWHMELEVIEIDDEDVDDDKSGEERDEDEGDIRDLGDDDGEDD